MLAAILLTAIATSGWLLLRERDPSRITVQSIEQTLARSGIARGATGSRLIEVLDSIGVHHSPLGRDRHVAANFGRSWTDGFLYAEVFGTFYLDPVGRLDSLRIREIATGP